jgi:hypothetical protein
MLICATLLNFNLPTASGYAHHFLVTVIQKVDLPNEATSTQAGSFLITFFRSESFEAVNAPAARSLLKKEGKKMN